MESRAEVQEKLTILLRDRVVFALLFGSVIRDDFRPESDIDVAVYLKQLPAKRKDLFSMLGALRREFERDLDIIVLNTSDIIITMQVLANGRLLLDNDHVAFVTFKARKISEYLDFKKDRLVIEKNLSNGKIYA